MKREEWGKRGKIKWSDIRNGRRRDKKREREKGQEKKQKEAVSVHLKVTPTFENTATQVSGMTHR